MTRIAIDYTSAATQSAGIGRATRDLTAALSGVLPPEVDLRLFVAGVRREALPAAPGRTRYSLSRFSLRDHNRLWHRLRFPLPVETWTGPIDLFHGTDFTLPPTRKNVRTVLTVHDLAYERYPAETMPGMLAFLRRAVPHSVQRADHVIAVSEATRRDLIDLYDTPPEKVSVIYHGVGAQFHPTATPDESAAIRTRLGLPAEAPLILSVGTMQPRKNHRRLVEAFARLDPGPVLVIAGGHGWDYEAVTETVERLGVEDRVVFPGWLDDSTLPALYRAASLFAYPAIYEGFGLPVLEAMACGTPVVAANASSLPEVVGEAGILIDPFDVEALAAALDCLLTQPNLRHSLGEKGIARAGDFTWTRAAEETWVIYQQVLAE